MPYFLHFTASKRNRIGRHGGLPTHKLLQPRNGLGVAFEVQYDAVRQFESGLSLSTKKESLHAVLFCSILQPQACDAPPLPQSTEALWQNVFQIQH